MQIRSVVVVAASGLASIAHGQSAAVQWRTQDGGNGHWYRVTVQTSGMTWDAARAAAETSGGYLACLESSGEAAWILSITGVPAAWSSRVGPWLGGYQDTSAADYSEPAGGWRWVNGAAWNFSDWPAGQPDNAFGAETVMHLITNIACGNSGAGRFINDLRPDFSAMGSCEQLPVSFVTEWSTDCNGDAIVDYGQILDGTFVDVDSNGIPDTCEYLADLTGDGVVNGGDLSIVLGFWGTPAKTLPAADLNRDGIVDAADLAAILGSWGPCP
jgi:hypothetical protein